MRTRLCTCAAVNVGSRDHFESKETDRQTDRPRKCNVRLRRAGVTVVTVGEQEL